MKIKALIISAALAAFFSSAHSQESPPPGIKPMTVPFQLFCADSFEFLMNVLAADFSEAPVAMLYLREGNVEKGETPTTMVIFTNEKNTQSTIVITKKTRYGESSCIAWSGRSPSAMALSLSPDPQFPPEPVKKEGAEL